MAPNHINYHEVGVEETKTIMSQNSTKEKMCTVFKTTHSRMMIVTAAATLLAILISLVYSAIMDFLLDNIWVKLPEKIVESFGERVESVGFLFTIFVCVTLCIAAAAVQIVLGHPGDLGTYIKFMHYGEPVPSSHVIPMVLVCLLSTVSGSSLGPEAALAVVACGASGFVAKYLKFEGQDALWFYFMTSGAVLACFFGVPAGGVLFAIEVLHVLGLQHYEYLPYALWSGCVSVTLFRCMTNQSFGIIWDLRFEERENGFAIPFTTPNDMFFGFFFGVIGAAIGGLFVIAHKLLGKGIEKLGLGHYGDPNRKRRILLALIAGLFVSLIGIICPLTMFWSEFEITELVTPREGENQIMHAWPKTGIFGPISYTPLNLCLIGFAKLFAISISVHGGLRGGIIFPLFFAGGAIGKAVVGILPDGFLSLSLALTCAAVSLNATVTRTLLASPFLVSAMVGIPNVVAPALLSSLTACVLTTNLPPFFSTQQNRQDIAIVCFGGDEDDIETALSSERESERETDREKSKLLGSKQYPRYECEREKEREKEKAPTSSCSEARV